MDGSIPEQSLQLTSTLGADGRLVVELAETAVAPPGPDEVLLRVEASPINPSDMMVLLPADPAAARCAGPPQRPRVTADIPPEVLEKSAGRIGVALPVGLEGAGTVIAAGENARHLLGRKVAALTLRSGMYSQYRTVAAAECAPLPEGVTAAEGAGLFCNPMTALAIVETLRLEGYPALVHTAAASNLGQMLAKICAQDGIPLVAVVRREEHVGLLRELGASHVCNSSGANFAGELTAAIAETGACVAFDAVGGAMPHALLAAMEAAALRAQAQPSPYGTQSRKQVYVYGHLEPSPIRLDPSAYGLLWDVSGWAMPPILARAGAERSAQMLQRVLANIGTTFASHFSREISLAQALQADTMRDYFRQATGEKYLINPQLQP